MGVSLPELQLETLAWVGANAPTVCVCEDLCLSCLAGPLMSPVEIASRDQGGKSFDRTSHTPLRDVLIIRQLMFALLWLFSIGSFMH